MKKKKLKTLAITAGAIVSASAITSAAIGIVNSSKSVSNISKNEQSLQTTNCNSKSLNIDTTKSTKEFYEVFDSQKISHFVDDWYSIRTDSSMFGGNYIQKDEAANELKEYALNNPTKFFSNPNLVDLTSVKFNIAQIESLSDVEINASITYNLKTGESETVNDAVYIKLSKFDYSQSSNFYKSINKLFNTRDANNAILNYLNQANDIPLILKKQVSTKSIDVQNRAINPSFAQNDKTLSYSLITKSTNSAQQDTTVGQDGRITMYPTYSESTGVIGNDQNTWNHLILDGVWSTRYNMPKYDRAFFIDWKEYAKNPDSGTMPLIEEAIAKTLKENWGVEENRWTGLFLVNPIPQKTVESFKVKYVGIKDKYEDKWDFQGASSLGSGFVKFQLSYIGWKNGQEQQLTSDLYISTRPDSSIEQDGVDGIYLNEKINKALNDEHKREKFTNPEEVNGPDQQRMKKVIYDTLMANYVEIPLVRLPQNIVSQITQDWVKWDGVRYDAQRKWIHIDWAGMDIYNGDVVEPNVDGIIDLKFGNFLITETGDVLQDGTTVKVKLLDATNEFAVPSFSNVFKNDKGFYQDWTNNLAPRDANFTLEDYINDNLNMFLNNPAEDSFIENLNIEIPPSGSPYQELNVSFTYWGKGYNENGEYVEDAQIDYTCNDFKIRLKKTPTAGDEVMQDILDEINKELNAQKPAPADEEKIKDIIASVVDKNKDKLPNSMLPNNGASTVTGDNIKIDTPQVGGDGTSVTVPNISIDKNADGTGDTLIGNGQYVTSDLVSTTFNGLNLDATNPNSDWSKVFGNDKGYAIDWYNANKTLSTKADIIAQYLKTNIDRYFSNTTSSTKNSIQVSIDELTAKNDASTVAHLTYIGKKDNLDGQTLTADINITLKTKGSDGNGTDIITPEDPNNPNSDWILKGYGDYVNNLSPRPDTQEEVKQSIIDYLNSKKDIIPDSLIPTQGFNNSNVNADITINDDGTITVDNVFVAGTDPKLKVEGATIKPNVDSTTNTTFKQFNLNYQDPNQRQLWEKVFGSQKGFAIDWYKSNLTSQASVIKSYLTSNFSELFTNWAPGTLASINVSIEPLSSETDLFTTATVTYSGYKNGNYLTTLAEVINITLKRTPDLNADGSILDKIEEALNNQNPKPGLGDEDKIKDIIAGVIEDNKNDLPNAWLPEDAWPENGGTITKDDITTGPLEELPDGTIKVPDITIDSDKSGTTGDTVLGDANIYPDVDASTNTTFNGLTINAVTGENWNSVFGNDKGFAIDWNKATNLNKQQDLLTQYIKNNATTLFTGIVSGSSTISSITTSINKPTSADQTSISASVSFMGYTNGRYEQKTSTNITITLKSTPSKGDNGVMDDLLDKIEQELNKPENRPAVDDALEGNKDQIKDIIAGVVEDNKNSLPDAMLPSDGNVDGGDITVGDLVENDDGSITVPDISIDTDNNGQGDVVIGDATVSPDVDASTNTTFNGLTINAVTGENWNSVFGNDKGFALDWSKATNLNTQSQNLKKYLSDNYQTLFTDAPKGTASSIQLTITKPQSDKTTELTVNFTYSGYKAGKYTPDLSATVKIILKPTPTAGDNGVMDDLLDKIEQELNKPSSRPAVDDALEGNKDPIKDIIAGVVEDNKNSLPDAMLPSDGNVDGGDITVGDVNKDPIDGSITVPDISIDTDGNGQGDVDIGDAIVKPIVSGDTTFKGLTINAVTGENWNSVFGDDKGFALDWYKATNLDDKKQAIETYVKNNIDNLFTNKAEGTLNSIEITMPSMTSSDQTKLSVGIKYKGWTGTDLVEKTGTINVVLKSLPSDVVPIDPNNPDAGWTINGFQDYIDSLPVRPQTDQEIKDAVADFINSKADDLPDYILQNPVSGNDVDANITRNPDDTINVDNIQTTTSPTIKVDDALIKPNWLTSSTTTIFKGLTVNAVTGENWSDVFGNEKGFAIDWNSNYVGTQTSALESYLRSKVNTGDPSSDLFEYAPTGTRASIKVTINPVSNNATRTTANVTFSGYKNGTYVENQLTGEVVIILKQTPDFDAVGGILDKIEEALNNQKPRPGMGDEDQIKDIIKDVINDNLNDIPNSMLPPSGTVDKDDIIIGDLTQNPDGSVNVPDISIDNNADGVQDNTLGSVVIKPNVDTTTNTDFNKLIIDANNKQEWSKVFGSDKGFALDWYNSSNLDTQSQALKAYLKNNVKSLFSNPAPGTADSISFTLKKPSSNSTTKITVDITYDGYLSGVYSQNLRGQIEIILKSTPSVGDQVMGDLLDKINNALNSENPKPGVNDEEKIKDIIAGVIDENKDMLPDSLLPGNGQDKVTSDNVSIDKPVLNDDGSITIPNIGIDKDANGSNDTLIGNGTILPDVDASTNTTFKTLNLDANNKTEWSQVFNTDKGFAIDWYKATSLSYQQESIVSYIKNNIDTLFTNPAPATRGSISVSINKPASETTTSTTATVTYSGYVAGVYTPDLTSTINITLKANPNFNEDGGLIDKIEEELNKPENKPAVDEGLTGNDDPVKDIIAGVVEDNKDDIPDSWLPDNGNGNITPDDIVVGPITPNPDGSINIPDISIDTDGNDQGDVDIGDVVVKPDTDASTNTTFVGLDINAVTGQNWTNVFKTDKGFAIDWYKAADLNSQTQLLTQYVKANANTLFKGIVPNSNTVESIKIVINKPTSSSNTSIKATVTFSGQSNGAYVNNLTGTINITLKPNPNFNEDGGLIDKIEDELNKQDPKPGVGDDEQIKDIIAGVVEDNKDDIPDSWLPDNGNGNVTPDDIIIGPITPEPDGSIKVPDISIDTDGNGQGDVDIGDAIITPNNDKKTTVIQNTIYAGESKFLQIFNRDKGFWLDWNDYAKSTKLSEMENYLMIHLNNNISTYFRNQYNTKVSNVKIEILPNNNKDKYLNQKVTITFSGRDEFGKVSTNMTSTNINISLRQTPRRGDGGFLDDIQYYLENKVSPDYFNGAVTQEQKVEKIKQAIADFLNLNKNNLPDLMLPENRNDNFLADDIVLTPTFKEDGTVELKDITTNTQYPIDIGDINGWRITSDNQSSDQDRNPTRQDSISSIIPIIIFSTLGGLVALLAIVLIIYISKRRKNDRLDDGMDGISW